MIVIDGNENMTGLGQDELGIITPTKMPFDPLNAVKMQ